MSEDRDVTEILKGIQQAFRNSKQVDAKIGLKREESVPEWSKSLHWTRHFDNFTIQFLPGGNLGVTYCTQLDAPTFYKLNLAQEVENYIADIVKYLKSEYKSVTGKTLTLTRVNPKEDPQIRVEHISNHRMTLYGRLVFKIGKVPDEHENASNTIAGYRDTFKAAMKKMKLV